MRCCPKTWTLFASALVLCAAVRPLGAAGPYEKPPAWACEAVWYQIFVERFRNGDPTNDPVPASMQGAYPGFVPARWTVTPWHQDWYEPQDWAHVDGKPFPGWIAARRFGGDLQGVRDKLDYLQALGVTAIYFNPLNDAPSLHKYDARHYRHIDRNFGPDPVGDSQIMAAENPLDPATWRWTRADRLFLELIQDLHRRDMRLIMDYSWNHTGITFWAWQDVQRHQTASRFRDWYDIASFDDPNTPENEFRFDGWLGVKTLPELKKVHVVDPRDGFAFEGDLQPQVKQHVLHVTRRWLDPNGDGDPRDGVDGFRLDVAAHVPLGFWRDYRTFVRTLNPNALLVGEAWWTQWPDQLMDPRPFLQGDIFDSVMHYQWYRPARRFFAQANGGLKPSAFVREMKRVYAGYDRETVHCLMNLTASHDSPRLATSFQNKHQYKFKMGARGNPGLDIGPPHETTLREMRMLLLHQFTFISAPHIWNGEELGMWGGDDPDCRKPLLWEEFDHAPQVYQPDGSRSDPIDVQPDRKMLRYYRQLIALRKQSPELVHGRLHYTLADDRAMTLVYRRTTADRDMTVAFNRSGRRQTLRLTRIHDTALTPRLESEPGCVTQLRQSESEIRFDLAPLSGVALGVAP